MGGRWFVTVVLAVLTAAAVACSSHDQPDGSVSPPVGETRVSAPRYIGPYSTGDFLDHIAEALETAGTYELAVKEINFVLPRWGGSDGGTVHVDLKTGNAVADLQRTGDGLYAIALYDGQTYFQRETCPTWARIQDAAGVLAAFIVTPEEVRHSRIIDVVATAPNSATFITRIDIQGIGVVTFEVEKSNSRPVHISSGNLTNNNQSLEWTFTNWGQSVAIPSIATDRLNGPGGNPC
ncbi:MAG: hypothetical protein ABI577_18270 [bacterium]